MNFDHETAKHLYRKIPTLPKAARQFAYNLIELIEGDVLARKPLGTHRLQQPAVLFERQLIALERAMDTRAFQ